MQATQGQQGAGKKRGGSKSLSKIFGRQLRRRILRTERQLMPETCRSIINTASQVPVLTEQGGPELRQRWEPNSAPMNMNWAMDAMPSAEPQERPPNPFMGGPAPVPAAHRFVEQQEASRSSCSQQRTWGSVNFPAMMGGEAEHGAQPAAMAAEDSMAAYMAMVAQSTGIEVRPQRELEGMFSKPPQDKGMDKTAMHPMFAQGRPGPQATAQPSMNSFTQPQPEHFKAEHFNPCEPVVFAETHTSKTLADEPAMLSNQPTREFLMPQQCLQEHTNSSTQDLKPRKWNTGFDLGLTDQLGYELEPEEGWDSTFLPPELPPISW